MKILQLLKQKQSDLAGCKPVTVAFLGDSVTQGCFECYETSPESVETVFEAKSAYSARFKELLNLLYPSVQINIVNSGISGDYASGGFVRLERDVLSYSPDLAVVSYGLNDSCNGAEKIGEYTEALQNIFAALKQKNVETIFLTQNCMNTSISPHLKGDLSVRLAKNFAAVQNGGVLKTYFEAARKVCKEYGIPVCEIYPVWEKMAQAGVNVTELLANKFNHPIREFHYYTAIRLLEKIFEVQ